MKKERISNSVIGRLPRYYRCVEELTRMGCARVSSSTLSERLGFTASQIRQDFSCFGEFGLQGYGYNVKKLHQELREILGLNDQRTAVLLGVGNLGRTLLKNFDFDACGFRLLAAFDLDEDVIGTVMETQTGPMRIIDGMKLRPFLRAEKPDMAVLSTPPDRALSTAQLLADFGVKAIWNFTDVELNEQQLGLVVEQVFLGDSLMTLGYRLGRRNSSDG